MFSRLKKILTFYDSEPTEITQGFIWFIFFPLIYTLEHGLNIFLALLSIVIGFCTLYGVAYQLDLRKRKTLAYAVFLFSVVAVIMYLLIHKNYNCPTHWGWLVISISAFFNLKRITNHYYCKKLKDDGI
jgi:xanthine/uracil permease